MKEKEEILFEKVSSLMKDEDQLLLDGMHIIEGEDEDLTVLKNFKIYHSDGYCFDICEREIENTDTNYLDFPYEFCFFSGYEGFKKIDVLNAIKLINKYL